MSQSIRAVYEKGRLRLIDTIPLQEGEEVLLTVYQNQDNEFRVILGDMLASYPHSLNNSSDARDDLLSKVQSVLAGINLSDSILEERENGSSIGNRN